MGQTLIIVRHPLLIVGLDGAGKSTIVQRLKSALLQQDIASTCGLHVERFKKGDFNFISYEIAGAAKYRKIATYYFKEVEGIVFVVDASDKLRVPLAKKVLESIIFHPDTRDIPLLIYSNKNDVPYAYNTTSIIEQLGLRGINNRSWHVVSTNALTGVGLDEGIDWMAHELKK